MNFMFYDQAEHPPVDFDVRSEIVSKDRFFETARKYISTDEKTLLQRQALFVDILKIDGLADFLVSLSEKLSEYSPLMQSHRQGTDHEEKIRHILYSTAYTELVRFVFESLSPMMKVVSSASIKRLFEMAKTDIESDEYKRLERYYEKNLDKLRQIRSVTVGVNLDAMYQPLEAGIVELNEEEFKSGDLLDRIIRLDFKKDEFHCIAPLTVIDKNLGFQESQQVNFALLKAMGRVLDSGLRHCSSRFLKYVKEKLALYFAMSESLGFVVEAIKRIRLFQEKSIPLCFPEISKDRSFRFVSLYDNALCHTKDKKEIVPNTICLEDHVCCYILTGPNSGGKTVFVNSLAAAQYYFQLGMPVPAKEASLPVCDAIFKISVEEQADVQLVGRFEKECITLSEVLKTYTKNSLALIDEAFTSTSAAEAVPIVANYIKELCQKGGKCVFITHYHGLGEERPIIACGEKIDYLHAESQGEQRTYVIRYGKAETDSYAHDIAHKYGLL